MVNQKINRLKALLFGTQNVFALVPGAALATGVMLVGLLLTNIMGRIMPHDKNVISPILVAIILGLMIRNIFTVPATFEPGIKFGLKKLLRFGIILMGIRLSVFSVLRIGGLAVGMVVICIIAALIITGIIAKKIGISEKLGTLIAAGTSICGVSAIVAVGPTIEAEEEEVAYAIGTITIFGILATIIYPYLTELILHLQVAQAGFFLGTSVHDTSQVTASSLIYDQLWSHRTSTGLSGADIAITTKLVRNTFMVVVIPLLGLWFARRNAASATQTKLRLCKYVPVFVFGYVVMGIIRSLGDYTFGTENASWVNLWGFIKASATYIIAIAVTCIGLNTNIRKLTNLGYRPFVCGFVAAVSVGGVSWLLAIRLGHFLQF